MPSRTRLTRALLLPLLVLSCLGRAAETVENPFQGITLVARTEAAPRALHMNVVIVDLSAPGLRFKLTAPGGKLETVRQTTLEFLKQEHAQIAINAHYFLPFPSPQPDAMLVGFAASEGVVYSGFETPSQSYAIVANAPALNIDHSNRARIVHRDPAFADGEHLLEDVSLWTALAGAAQIVTNGVKTIPQYTDDRHPSGQLTPGGPGGYSNSKSWYDALNARTAIGLTRDGRSLILFTVDARGASAGMAVGEVADLLIKDYGVFNALLLDGGGSTTLAMEDPNTHAGAIRNVSSDNPNGRSVGSNLAIFATPILSRPLP
jgi:exopolysaccharide biosynthesis protein